MRIGDNPHKHSGAVPPPPEVTLAVIAHTSNEPYHAQHKGVAKLCLRSMIEGGPQDAELLIWDNGSPEEFVRWLRTFSPDVVVQSPNVGVSSARKGIFALARGKYVICTDDDVFFYPGWFDKQMEVLKTYPHVGLVGGSPIRTMFRWACGGTINWARANAKLEQGRLIPEQYERDFCTSIGRDYEFHKQYSAGDWDSLIEYKGVKAWAHGHHMQFLCERDVIQPFCRDSIQLMDSMKPFDMDIDNAGLLRLTTHERTVRHIGNVIDDDIRAEAEKYGYL